MINNSAHNANKKYPSVCIIGAGSSGIAACKVFKQAGIPFVCYEAGDKVGGNWVFKNKNNMSSAYRSLHINVSTLQMAYSDFPIPEDYPDFPSHFLIAKYFDDYVEHFAFKDNIVFNTTVKTVQRRDDGLWDVSFNTRNADEKSLDESRVFDVVLVANGHHWNPRWPEPKFPGTFNGLEMHSHYYIDPSDPHDLTDKNVVVVGMGNSALDIACELGHQGVSKHVYLSVRRSNYIFPKYIAGKPFDRLLKHPSQNDHLTVWLRKYTPLWLQDRLARFFLGIYGGKPQNYGLQAPSHGVLDAHPSISDEICIRLGSGDIIPKTNIKELKGDKVLFDDGSEVEADIIIYATGYKITFPFFDENFIAAKDNDIALYQRMIDPKYNNLFFLALVQPLCAMMPIAEEQAKFIAAYLTGEYHLPQRSEMERMTNAEYYKTKNSYVASKRHTIQIDCQTYTYKLRKELKKGQERARNNNYKLPVNARADSLLEKEAV